MKKLIELFYDAEKIAREHAKAAWGRGEEWKCVCPACEKVRDRPRIQAVELIK